jgi:fructokinase
MNEFKPVIFGEVLLDIFPDGNKVLGGAPFNVAWHLQGFGLDPILISRVGNDDFGNEIIDAMKAWNMNITGIQVDEMHPTGRVNIKIQDGEPSYTIQENCAYDFIDKKLIRLPAKPGIFYHGSLALRAKNNQDLVQHLRLQMQAKNNHSLSFVDINLRPPWYEMENLRGLLKKTDYLKLNENELSELADQQSAQDIIAKALSLNKSLHVGNMIITQGESGAFMIDASDNVYQVQPEKNEAVVDTVGAGDAFSSVIILGIIKDWSSQDTLNRAQAFASSIISQQGATMRNPYMYNNYKEIWNL